MRARLFTVVVAAGLFVAAGAGSGAAQCRPDGDVEFVCGPVSPEDLVAVPESPWVIVAGMEDDGYVYATDTRNHRSTVLFPTASFGSRPDPAFGDCGGPLTGGFRPHGLNLRPGPGGRHTLYVVRHGAREAIEIFELDARGPRPVLTWTGCAPAPDGVTFNSVAALPAGGFAATHFARPEGRVWEWAPDAGWTAVPGTETNGPNGIVASPDGRWLYIGGWGTRSLIRVSRGENPVRQDAVEVGFHIDNVRWAPDGSLLAAGHLGDAPRVDLRVPGPAALRRGDVARGAGRPGRAHRGGDRPLPVERELHFGDGRPPGRRRDLARRHRRIGSHRKIPCAVTPRSRSAAMEPYPCRCRRDRCSGR